MLFCFGQGIIAQPGFYLQDWNTSALFVIRTSQAQQRLHSELAVPLLVNPFWEALLHLALLTANFETETAAAPSNLHEALVRRYTKGRVADDYSAVER